MMWAEDVLRREDSPMAWESRGTRGKTYYYSAKRRGGNVVKTYHGAGVIGELAADAVEQGRRGRSQEAEALSVAASRLEVPERALEALDRACASAGSRVDRGRLSADELRTMEEATMDENVGMNGTTDSERELRYLLEWARRGNEHVLL